MQAVRCSRVSKMAGSKLFVIRCNHSATAFIYGTLKNRSYTHDDTSCGGFRDQSHHHHSDDAGNFYRLN